MYLTPACPIVNIFVLTGDIGDWGQGRRCEEQRGWIQELAIQRRGGEGGVRTKQVRTGKDAKHRGGGSRDNRGDRYYVNGGGAADTNGRPAGVQGNRWSRGEVLRGR